MKILASYGALLCHPVSSMWPVIVIIFFYYIFWVSDYIVHLANDITCSIGLSLLIVSFTFLYVVQGDQLLIGRKSSLDLNWLVGVTPFPWWPILDSLLTYHMELLILNGRTCGYRSTRLLVPHMLVSFDFQPN